jgi:polysaccharide export outer membrane protein
MAARMQISRLAMIGFEIHTERVFARIAICLLAGLILAAESGPAAQDAKPGPEQSASESDASGGAAARAKLPSGPPGYRIGAGDVLQIVVWKEPDASVPSVVVRADGKISVPLIKEVEVLGMTPAELETLLAAKLSQFIHGADVTVVPKEIHSQKVYLLGAVKKEGPVLLQSSMTVLQAITEAGGLTDYAKPKKIYILRKENGKQTRLPFNYQAVIKGEQMEQNIVLIPEDVVVIPH